MKRIASITLAGLFCLLSVQLRAQSEVGTTALLYNAPYRHYINPAFEPMTNGYFYLPAVSHLNIYAGNNSLSLSDLIINQGGTTMWTLNPESQVNPLDAIRNNMLVNADVNLALLGFGWRTDANRYFHVNINERVDAGVTLPKDLFRFALGGGMTDIEGVNNFNLSALGAKAQVYTEVAFGMSGTAKDIWTWGFKAKMLLGHAYANWSNKNLELNASADQWSLTGNGQMQLCGPFATYPESMSGEEIFGGFDWANCINPKEIKPAQVFNGFGAAFDLGFTVKPIQQLTVAVALTDVGAIYWHNGHNYNQTWNGTFDGIGSVNYSEYTDKDGNLDTERLTDTLTTRLQTVAIEALHSEQGKTGFASMLTMKLNASVEGNFFNDLLGVGVYSKTMLYNNRLFEEVTLGAAVRPASWFNFGVSYSFLNGKWSNIGVGMGLRGGPIMLSLAADYVPMSYATAPDSGKAYLPYKTQGVNLELGLGIVWGWKKAKAAKNTSDLEATN